MLIVVFPSSCLVGTVFLDNVYKFHLISNAQAAFKEIREIPHNESYEFQQAQFFVFSGKEQIFEFVVSMDEDNANHDESGI